MLLVFHKNDGAVRSKTEFKKSQNKKDNEEHGMVAYHNNW